MSTNEFWADGMRGGKAVGFTNGVEAAKEKLRRTGFKNVDEFFADLSPAPTYPVPSDPYESLRTLPTAYTGESPIAIATDEIPPGWYLATKQDGIIVIWRRAK